LKQISGADAFRLCGSSVMPGGVATVFKSEQTLVVVSGMLDWA
jgi:hypothetical protein